MPLLMANPVTRSRPQLTKQNTNPVLIAGVKWFLIARGMPQYSEPASQSDEDIEHRSREARRDCHIRKSLACHGDVGRPVCHRVTPSENCNAHHVIGSSTSQKWGERWANTSISETIQKTLSLPLTCAKLCQGIQGEPRVCLQWNQSKWRQRQSRKVQ